MSFSLADALKGVSELDTGRDQIEYIRLDLIDSDENNFYQLSDLDSLASNIACCGLQQPIRVRRKEDGRYVIVSGHRRRAAIEMLAAEDPEKWQEVPCIVEQDAASPALQQLRLIYANASTRKLTPAEISEQAVQVEKLLYQLKEEEGYEFPGRMRDHVAQAVGVSKTKLARLKVIREGLADFWMPFFENNSLHESTANYLAQLPKDDQLLIHEFAVSRYGAAEKISAAIVEAYRDRSTAMTDLICPMEGIPCENMGGKKNATIRCGIYAFHSCGRCCATCSSLTTCRYACPKLAEQIAKIKAENREKKREEKQKIEESTRPSIDQIQNLWTRFGFLREQAGKTVQDVFHATQMFWSVSDDKRYKNLEAGRTKISAGQDLPYGYSFSLTDAKRLIAIADLFGCTLDELFCRTDVAVKPELVSNSGTTWQTGEPDEPGTYLLMLDSGYGSRQFEKWAWDGAVWKDFVGAHDPDIDGEIRGWIPMPKEV